MDSPSGSLLNRLAPEIALFILPHLCSSSVDSDSSFFFLPCPCSQVSLLQTEAISCPHKEVKAKAKGMFRIFSSQPLFLTAGSDSEYYFRFLVVLLYNILIVFFVFFLIGVTHLPLLLLKGLKVPALATPLTGSSGDTLYRKSILILKGPKSFLTSCQRGKKGLPIFFWHWESFSLAKDCVAQSDFTFIALKVCHKYFMVTWRH